MKSFIILILLSLATINVAAAEMSPDQFIEEFFTALRVQDGETIGQLVLKHPRSAEQAYQMLKLAGTGSDAEAEQFQILAEVLQHALNLMKLNRFIEEAEQAYQAADYATARAKLQTGLKQARKVKEPRYISQFLSDLGVVYDTLAQYPKALEYYAQAFKLKNESGDKQGASQKLTQIGIVYTKLGQYQQALTYYQQAVEIQRQLGNQRELGNNLSNLGEAYLKLGQYQAALEHFQQALTIHQTLAKEPAEIGRTLSNLGVVYDHLGQYQQALDAYQQALKIQRQLGDETSVGHLLINLGVVYNHFGQYPKALEYYQQALAIYHKLGSQWGESISLNNLANVYQNIGHYQAALETYQQALTLQRTLDNQPQVGENLSNLGAVFQTLGQYQQALDYYQPALDIFQNVGDKRGECAVLTNIGVVHDSLGLYQPALTYFQQALTINREIGSQSGEGTDLSKIGHVHYNLGHYQQALDYYQQALTIHRTLGNKAEEGMVLNQLGTVYTQLQRYQSALQAYQQALTIHRNIGSADLWIAQRGLASVEVYLKQMEAAITHYGQALNNIEKLRAGLAEKEHKLSFMQDKLEVYDEFMTLLQILHLQHPQKGYAQKALETFERKQGRGFLEEMGQSGIRRFAGLPQSIIEQEQKIIQQYTKIQTDLVREKSQLAQNRTLIKTLTQRLETLNLSDQVFQQEIEAQYPNYAALKYPQPVTLDMLQNQVLQTGERLLVYNVMKNQTVLWIIGPTQFALFTLPITEDSVGEQVAYLRMLIQNQLPELAPESFLLYQNLIPATAHQLLAGAKTLYIVPTGPLYGLPFETLVRPKNNQKPHYLIQDYAIIYLSSASLLKILRDTSARRNVKTSKLLLAFANPVYPPCEKTRPNISLPNPETFPLAPEVSTFPAQEATEMVNLNELRTRAYLKTLGQPCFPALPETAAEATTIAALFKGADNALYLGPQASRRTVFALNDKGELDDYRYLLFAVHGILPNEVKEIEQPALVLSNPLTEGYLTMADAFQLQLNADFINLSACNTGRGENIRGEGIMGLTRAFMYAGTSAISVSLWAVESLSAKKLSIGIFANLKADYQVAEALRQIKLQMLSQTDYRHPFYWAPFVVYGDSVVLDR
jgi:tetratricopeptide (TPR) repeat protein